MNSAPGPGPETLSRVAAFCSEHFASSGAARYEIDRQTFTAMTVAVVERWKAAPSANELSQFLEALHLNELVLTRACAAGHEKAWEYFLNRYRATLYGAAYKIAHDESSARELADSLYAELYGISPSGAARVCKLLYYSGRGSLEGWLRTIVAQEYVNRYRRTRRERSLEETVGQGAQFPAPPAAAVSAADERMDAAIAQTIAALNADDRFLLATYYLDGRTLAEIGKLLRVHESTVSRKLERTTADLRKSIRRRLIESGMSQREAEERMQELDVRDVQLPIAKSLRQDSHGHAFYQEGER